MEKQIRYAIFMVLSTFLGIFPLQASDTSTSPTLHWEKHVINSHSKYEAAGIGDINQDGKLDIVCGEYWYESPTWHKHWICKIEEQDDYFNDFANLLQDVDHDKDLDIVSVTWFSQEALWRENPGNRGGEWKIHSIDKPGNSETGFFFDLNGDGVLDLIPNVAQELVWFEKVKGKSSWIKRTVGKNGAGHGLGVGDVNGDGQADFVGPNGWMEITKTKDNLDYSWHPEWKLDRPSVPMIVDDINQDGLNDVLYGAGHGYGVYWLEQQKNQGKREWKQHAIDTSWSQAHAIFWLDLNGDGTKELLTGKRYHAHNGHDPGGNDPLGIYLYHYNKQTNTWSRQTIDQGTRAGFGLMPAMGDIDQDGDLDIVCPGKSGLYLFEQIR